MLREPHQKKKKKNSQENPGNEDLRKEKNLNIK